MGLPLSLTAAVNVAVPLEVGVPEMVPVDAAKLSPAGRLPDAMDHRYGVVPPLACNDCEYVALAEDLGVRLVTADRDVLRHFPRVAIHPRDFVRGTA